MTSLYSSVSAATSTWGGPILISAQAMGSTIHSGIETTMPDGPSTLRNLPVARSSTRRTLTFRPT